MQDYDLIKLCEIALQSQMRFFIQNDCKGLCGHTSSCIQHILYILHIDCDQIYGQVNGDGGHWFLQLRDGRILDPTAGQFRTPIDNEIYLGPLPENYVILQNHGRNF